MDQMPGGIEIWKLLVCWFGNGIIVIPSFASTLESKPSIGPPIGLSIDLATTLIPIGVISQDSWTKYGFKKSGYLMIFKVLVTGLVLAVFLRIDWKCNRKFCPVGSYPCAYTTSSPLQAMLVFWIFGSFTEEVVFRGLIQGWGFWITFNFVGIILTSVFSPIFGRF